MTLAVEDIVNLALDAIGFSRHIGDIYEGSPAARVALEVYGQTRDEVLQAGDWPFALREALLVAVAAVTPPSPWLYEYTYPTDCLRIRYVRPGPLTGATTREFDPQPVLFRPWNDQRPATPVRAILCDLSSAVLIYNGKVTNPGTWEPEFVRALVAALETKMSLALTEQAELLKLRLAVSAGDMGSAMAVDDLSAPAPEGPAHAQQR